MRREPYPLVGKNAARAESALMAIETFQKTTGLGEADGLDTAIYDFLADLMHLCVGHGLDFDEIFEKARWHYGEETMHKCRKCERAHDPESDSAPSDDLCVVCAGP